MAELETVEAPEIDVDAMSDEEFASFKAGMETGDEQTTEPEPKPEAATTEEVQTAEEDDDDLDAEHPKSETVSFGRFNRTNERRKEAERKAQEASERAIRLEERLQAIIEAQQGPKQPEQQPNPADEVPNENDPIAILNWARKELMDRKTREAEEAKQRETQTREQQAWNEVIATVQKDYNATVEKDPSLVEAHNAWRNSLGQELLAMGYSQAQAIEEVNRQENAHIGYVYQTNQNVGEYIKKMAGIRGWAPKPAEPASDPKNDMNAIAKREEARQASMSLGKSGGATADIGKITPQQIAEMSDEEFAAYREKHSIVDAFQ